MVFNHQASAMLMVTSQGSRKESRPPSKLKGWLAPRERYTSRLQSFRSDLLRCAGYRKAGRYFLHRFRPRHLGVESPRCQEMEVDNSNALQSVPIDILLRCTVYRKAGRYLFRGVCRGQLVRR